MSIFSHFRKSRQQAKEHNAKLAEQKQKEQDKPPYKHVPTHAAADSIASAPPSWREADRPRIAEQNRRRSAMAATGHHMNMPGIPRVGSSLSHVSFPSDRATPMVRLPRAYSYTGVPSYPDRNRDVNYSVPDMSYSQTPSLKGKEVSRMPPYEMMRVSPTSSKGERSPVESSSGSSSSQDDLEMRPARRSYRAAAQAETAHRLHPSHSRGLSEASVERLAIPSSAKTHVVASTAREARPPPSMRGFGALPVPSTPLAKHPASLAAQVHAPPTSNPVNQVNVVQPSVTEASRQSSTYSLPGLTPSSSKGQASAPLTPAATNGAQPDYSLNWLTLPGAGIDMTSSTEPSAATHASQAGKYKDRRTSKTARFTNLERIESSVEPPYMDLDRADPSRAPQPLAHEDIVNVFPEQAVLPDSDSAKPSKKQKLSKTGGRLLKKNRWSMSSKSSTLAV